MWVEPVTSSGRSAYERRIGAPITRLPGTRPAGVAATYLPAMFVTGLPFRPGVDVSGLPALAATLRNPQALEATMARLQTGRGAERIREPPDHSVNRTISPLAKSVM